MPEIAPPHAERRLDLREPRAGDWGWVVSQHGEVYAREYGYDARFEALVAQIMARMITRFDPAREKGWIAELDGRRVGSAFVVRRSARTAQLRMLIVSPQARGLGLGGQLTDECIAFARSRGYRRMVLWTHAQLTAARAIYAGRGFELQESEPLEAYGQSLVSETWKLDL